MRKILAAAAVVAMAAPAFASLSLDGRYDYASLTSNSTATSTSGSESGFGFNYLRLGGAGTVADGFTFKTRLNLMAFNVGNASVADQTFANTGKSLTAGGVTVFPGASGLLITSPSATQPNDFVDYASVRNTISDTFSLTFGKLDSMDAGFGGFESMTKSEDMYFASQGYLGNKFFSGLDAAYKFADNQEVDFLFFNNDNATDNSRPGVNLVYRGTFGNVGVIANYSQIGENNFAGTTTAVNKNLMTVGLSYKMDVWNFTLDYDAYTNPTNTLSINKSNMTQNSIVANARYDMGNWTPALKLESTSRTGFEAVGSDVSDSVMNWSLAAEYKKNSADPFRYHIAYVSGATTLASTTAYGGIANASITGQFVYVGMRYMGDFLK